MKPCHVSAEDMPKVGPLVQKLITTAFANLPGSDEKKCQNEALREAVKKEMEWPHPPGGRLLFTQLQLHRERAKAPEKKPPKRRGPPKKRGPPSPSPPPSAKRSESEPAPAKAAPLAEQNRNTSAIVATNASSPFETWSGQLAQAIAAFNGEKVAGGAGSIPKACEVRLAGEGDDKWRRFKRRKDAAAAFSGLTATDVTKLCKKTASPFLLAKGFEARDVDEGLSMSKREPYASVLRAANLCFRQADVSSDEGAWKVSGRGAWEVDGQPPPESWGLTLERFGEFSEEVWRKFTAATGEAEAARVRLKHAATLTGTARLAMIRSRRAAAAASARATSEALRSLIDEGFVSEGDLDVIRADDREIQILYLDPDAPKVAGRPVMIKYEGNLVQLKGGPPFERYALAPGNLVLAQRGVRVATLERPTPNDSTYLTAPFARGTLGYTHGGEGGPYAATITPQQEPGDFVRGLAFNSLDSMKKVGFHAVRGTRTAATTYGGAVIEDAGTIQFELFLNGFEGDLMPALDDELFRFSEALLATSRTDPRLREGVDASYRRDQRGIGRNPAFLFAQPCRADTGPTLRTLRGLEYLRTNDYPIMYEVARRCNWHCVRFELVAYREVVPTRVRLHVDKMAELSISTGGVTSAALARA